MKLALLSIIALLIVGCNDTTEIIEVTEDGNSTLRVKSSTAIGCDDILELTISGKDANVTIGEDNYFSSGDLFIDYYIYAECDTNTTEVDDNGTD